MNESATSVNTWLLRRSHNANITRLSAAEIHFTVPSRQRLFCSLDTLIMVEISSSKPVKKTKTAPSHPSMLNMVIEALTTLKDRKGVSVPAIKGYILSRYTTVSPSHLTSGLRRAFKTGLESGVLVRPKNSEANGVSGRLRLGKLPEKPKKKPVKKTTPKKKAVKKTAKKTPKKDKKPKAKATTKKTDQAKKTKKAEKTTTKSKKTATKKPSVVKKTPKKTSKPKKPVAKKVSKKVTKK